jgi:mono/diheme cytochrome c family protein
MKILTAAALFLPMALAAGAPANRPPASSAPPDTNPRIEHGRYLVHQVALCVQCHSPRDENGRLLETRLLSGARIPVSSPFPSQPWAYQAPDIRGMVGYTEEEGIRLLTEGITRGGTPPRPPMQQFHLSRDDARDVVAYLKSLR